MNLPDTTIGIIIGSGFTVLGVILQGAISWFLNWKTHKMTLDEQSQKEKRAKTEEMWHKKEAAYKNFVDIVGLVLMLSREAADEVPYPIPKNIADGSIFKEMANAMTSIQLYGSPKIADEVRKFMSHTFNRWRNQKPSPEEIVNADMTLQNLANEMKADLLQSDNGKKAQKG